MAGALIVGRLRYGKSVVLSEVEGSRRWGRLGFSGGVLRSTGAVMPSAASRSLPSFWLDPKRLPRIRLGQVPDQAQTEAPGELLAPIARAPTRSRKFVRVLSSADLFS